MLCPGKEEMGLMGRGGIGSGTKKHLVKLKVIALREVQASLFLKIGGRGPLFVKSEGFFLLDREKDSP